MTEGKKKERNGLVPRNLKSSKTKSRTEHLNRLVISS